MRIISYEKKKKKKIGSRAKIHHFHHWTFRQGSWTFSICFSANTEGLKMLTINSYEGEKKLLHNFQEWKRKSIPSCHLPFSGNFKDKFSQHLLFSQNWIEFWNHKFLYFDTFFIRFLFIGGRIQITNEFEKVWGM